MKTYDMISFRVPLISAAERLNAEAVIITFADGKCALYSASLLYSTLAQAQLIDQTEELPID